MVDPTRTGDLDVIAEVLDRGYHTGGTMVDTHWHQLPLFGDDRIRLEIRFNQLHGWEHSMTARYEGDWTVMSEGLHRSWDGALEAALGALREVHLRTTSA